MRSQAALVVIVNTDIDKSVQLSTSTAVMYSILLLNPVKYKITVTTPG